MEWIVTEAATLEAAKELALDRLGVDESEAEFDILVEPSIGLLGLRRVKAQVRARVAPRPLPEFKKGRTRKQSKHSSKTRQSASASRLAKVRGDGKQPSTKANSELSGQTAGQASKATDRKNNRERKKMTEATEDAVMQETEQKEIARSFIEGAVHAFDPQAVVNVTSKEGTLYLAVESDASGLLIGPKGTTLAALEDLMHVCIRRRARGRRYSRVRLDVGGYRRLRRERLEEFTQKIAREVCETAEAIAFEPMGSLDRKIVHDVALGIDGVQTRSEGEDPRRRVVMFPSD